MKAVLLVGSPADHRELAVVESLALRALEASGHTTVTFRLCDLKMAACLGDFDCWVKTPGRCRTHDAQQQIVAAIHDADVLVFLGPVTFGGYPSELKKAVDRLIGLVSPFFTHRDGLTHHALRYERFPRLAGIGWLPAPDEERHRIFRALVESNALNMGAPGWGAVVVDGDPASSGEAIADALAACATPGNFSGDARATREALLAAARPDPATDVFELLPRTAVLIGSARPQGTSNSETLARHLLERLEAKGARATIRYASSFVHDGIAADCTAHDLATSELFILASPLYVDSLPYLATRALERVARVRSDAGRPPARFVALMNCGFPEAEHNRVALAIARSFAHEAGYVWAGGLALGGGEAIHGRPLADVGGLGRHVRHALEVAGDALGGGGVIPESAIRELALPLLPSMIYRLVGDRSWRSKARENGLKTRDLRSRPLDELH